MANKEVLERML